jgi:hypothetical protein
MSSVVGKLRFESRNLVYSPGHTFTRKARDPRPKIIESVFLITRATDSAIKDILNGLQRDGSGDVLRAPEQIDADW